MTLAPSATVHTYREPASTGPAVARGRRGACRAGGYIRPFFAYTLGMSRYDRPSHQVYIYFFKRGGWQVQFLEADLKTPLPRRLTFSEPEKGVGQARGSLGNL